MTSPKKVNRQLVDQNGQPLPRKVSIFERIWSAAVRTKTIVISIASVLAIVAGVITNTDDIEKFFIPILLKAVGTEFQSSSVLTDVIEVTKVQPITDQITQIRKYDNTGLLSLYWKVILSNNGENNSSIVDYDVLQVSELGAFPYIGLKQGLYTFHENELQLTHLPLTIPSGSSCAIYIRLGVEMDAKAYSLVKLEFDGSSPKTTLEIIDFLHSRGVDMYGNSLTKIEGGYSFPSFNEMNDPAFGIIFKTSRGADSSAIISWYKNGFFYNKNF